MRGKAALCALVLTVAVGCSSNRPRRLPPLEPGPGVAPGDPYRPGRLGARTIRVSWGTQGAPASLRIHRPERPGTYPVIVLQHGFAASHASYDDLCLRLASHGFVVVSPQMYGSGLTGFLTRPPASREAEVATRLLGWLGQHLDAFAGVDADTSRIGLVGHSRGGKIVWMMLREDPSLVRAVAVLDPVDMGGSPLQREVYVTRRPFTFRGPVLIVGAGLEGRCAPEDWNHEWFFASARAPAWHVVVPAMGHADMLDADAAWRAAIFCGGGRHRASSQKLTAGLLVAFFRASLLDGEEDAYLVLGRPEKAPIPFRTRRKRPASGS